MDMSGGKTWTCRVVQHGHVWWYSVDMSGGTAWTCRVVQHGHIGWYSMDMSGGTAWTCRWYRVDMSGDQTDNMVLCSKMYSRDDL